MRRRDHPLAAIGGEVRGDFSFERPGGTFRLTGRADRIERWADEALAILDYKTGKPPTQTEVDAGLAPQLLLEAAMAEAGAFGPELAGHAAELTYWRLTGGFEPGAEFLVCKGDAGKIRAAVRAAHEHLCRLVDAFDVPGRCYVSRPHPAWAPRFSDYEQLARIAEWAAAEDTDLNGGN
jgi:ATP-dependent helicase/nuclease subunit B